MRVAVAVGQPDIGRSVRGTTIALFLQAAPPVRLVAQEELDHTKKDGTPDPKYDKAIDHYMKAWEHAQKAIKHGTKK